MTDNLILCSCFGISIQNDFKGFRKINMIIPITQYNIIIQIIIVLENYLNVMGKKMLSISVQQLSRVRLFVTPQTAAHHTSLSFTISRNLLKLIFIESVMPSNHLILCHLFLLLPLIFPSIRVFSKELALQHQVVKVLELQLQHQSLQ